MFHRQSNKDFQTQAVESQPLVRADRKNYGRFRATSVPPLPHEMLAPEQLKGLSCVNSEPEVDSGKKQQLKQTE